MRHKPLASPALWLGFLLALAGCASSASDLAPQAPDRPWHPATDARGAIVPGPEEETGAATPGGYVLPANPALATARPDPAVDPAKVYDLVDLIDLAESNNPRTRIAWNAARNAALAVGITRAAYLPHLAFSALSGAQASHGGSSALGLGVDTDTSSTGGITALSLQWLLFDFGERDALVEGAQQMSVASNIAFTAEHQKLIHDVSLAFYADTAARAHVVTAERSLQDAQEIQQAAEERYGHGIGTVIEVAQAKQATAQARLALVQAQGLATDSRTTLLAAVGISPLLSIRVADVSGRPLAPTLEGQVEKLVTDSLARRPDVLGAYATLKASKAGVQAATADFLPKVFLSATGTYAGNGLSVSAIPSIGPDQSPTLNLSGHRLGGVLIGGVTVPIYDGGTRDALLAQARTREDTAQRTLEQVKQDAIQQIVMASNALHTSLETQTASQALLDAAQTTHEATLAAYRRGVGALTEVLLAERQLLVARNAVSDSYSLALSAAATLALATGELGAAP